MPKVSAVMALYNTPFEYLDKTISSILTQTLKDFELIVVDDGSEIDYSKYFENKDERIKYHKLEQNKGPGYARNFGMKLAEGEYIAICDSDDIYLPKRFELQVDFLDKNPQISLLGGDLKYSGNGKIYNSIRDDNDIKVNMIFNSQIPNPIAMFRRKEFIEKNVFFEENIQYGEDYKIWLNAMFAGLKFANLPEVLMIYTRRKGQLSKAKAEIQYSSLKRIYSETLNALNVPESYVSTIQKIENSDYKNLSENEIKDFFQKLAETNFFDIDALKNKENMTLESLEKYRNRLFKIKIGTKNFCISRQLKIYIENRD